MLALLCKILCGFWMILVVHPSKSVKVIDRHSLNSVDVDLRRLEPLENILDGICNAYDGFSLISSMFSTCSLFPLTSTSSSALLFMSSLSAISSKMPKQIAVVAAYLPAIHGDCINVHCIRICCHCVILCSAGLIPLCCNFFTCFDLLHYLIAIVKLQGSRHPLQ